MLIPFPSEPEIRKVSDNIFAHIQKAIDHLKVASQPVQGPWPPHQEPRPEPDAESLPVAIADPHPHDDES